MKNYVTYETPVDDYHYTEKVDYRKQNKNEELKKRYKELNLKLIEAIKQADYYDELIYNLTKSKADAEKMYEAAGIECQRLDDEAGEVRKQLEELL